MITQIDQIQNEVVVIQDDIETIQNDVLNMTEMPIGRYRFQGEKVFWGYF